MGVTVGSPPKEPTIFADKLSQRIKITLGLVVVNIESVSEIKRLFFVLLMMFNAVSSSKEV